MCICLRFAFLAVMALPVLADTPHEIIDKAIDLLENDRHAEAKRLLEDVMQTLEEQIAEEDSGELQYELGRAAYFLGRDEQAMTAFDKSIAMTPTIPHPHVMKGGLLRAQGKVDAAIEEFKKATELGPDNAAGWVELGRTYMQKEDATLARAPFEKALKISPRNATALFSLAVIEYDEGKHETAIRRMLEVAKLTPDDVNTHYNLGQWYQLAGKHQESLRHFLEVVRLDPNGGPATAKVVQCYQALGKTKERDEFRKRVLDLHAKGRFEDEFYCRDQFTVGRFSVMVFEYFEMTGEKAVCYSFNVIPKGKDEADYRISLGSYDMTNRAAHLKPDFPKDKRMFHLDRYFPSGRHELFAFYPGEPTYDEVRPVVIRIIEEKQQVISWSRPTSQSSRKRYK